MLDIKFIRDNLELVQDGARKKQINVSVAKLIEVDDKRRSLRSQTEALRARHNEGSKQIAELEGKERERLIAEMTDLKDQLTSLGERIKPIEEAWKLAMLEIPNIPDPSVPEGGSDAQNKEIRAWGEKPNARFAPKSHIELMTARGMLEMERGAKVAGFRGYFLAGDAVLLAFALMRYALDVLSSKGFNPLIAPSLVRPFNFVGTGWLPQGKDEVYKTQDDLYLAGTAEVPVMGYYASEILNEDDLPVRFVAFSPCFRREAGSHGKDTQGIMRVHEFMKIEQVVLCKADHQESVRWHEEITKHAEMLMQSLGLPYRVVVNCGGDLGLGQVKKYDIEAWVPSEERYRETHSSSYFHDFQTRRLNIRYRSADGKLQFVHSLNNTALALPRLLVPFVEVHQREDGSIAVPEVLREYLGKEFV